jgi:acetyl esterase/lipase
MTSQNEQGKVSTQSRQWGLTSHRTRPLTARSVRPSRLLLALALALALVVGATVAAPMPASAMASGASERRFLDVIIDEVNVEEGLVFGGAVNNLGVTQELRLDLYLPKGDREKKRPAIVFAHGGGFKKGNRKARDVVDTLTRFARQGYVAASIDYRLRPEGTPGSMSNAEILAEAAQGKEPALVLDARHDMQSAVRWFRANAKKYDVDPNLIVVGGSSAGAVTALQTAFNPHDPGASGNPGHPSDVAAAISFSGASGESQIEAGAPPIVMHHGTEDAFFSAASSTCEATLELGNACRFHPYLDQGHGLWKFSDELISDSARFLCNRLLGGCPRADGSKASCKHAAIVGTRGRDRLSGTPGRDVINARGGSDVVRGRGGSDIICGRGGGDSLHGDRGNDVLVGGRGGDSLHGGPGEDVCRGGSGSDRTRRC